MGGEVGVESRFGKGSTFWVSVPLERGAPARVLLPPPDLRGTRVLVVDDNHTAATVLSDMLQAMGFVVEQAHSGLEALDRLRESMAHQQPFGLLLLDWHMPGMDGVELAGHIRSLGMPKVPQMLMVTAYGREDVMRAARAQGIETVLIKPVNASLLFDTLMQPLEASGSERRRAVTPAPAADELPLDIRGASVLLVEDNELNQMVAMELLLDAGFAVDVAENGQIAIDHIERKHYDAVLMDMQMPVMDGETATRLLRGNPRYAQLPIIAMTANAMEADRQRCFAAGMNDHVAKPIEPAALWAALARWIRPREGLGAAVPPARSNAAPVAASMAAGAAGATAAGWLPVDVPDLPGLDTNLGLQRALGKTGLYAEMLRRFVQGQAPVLPELQRALAVHDVALAERLAHTLRSVAANIGAQAVSDRAQALEHALRFRHGNEAIVPLLAELRAALQPLLQGLQEWMLQAVQGPTAPEPGMARSAGVSGQGMTPPEAEHHLRHLLEQDDPAATVFFQHNGVLLKAALGSAFQAVEKHTLNFDFEQALEAMAAVPGSESTALESP